MHNDLLVHRIFGKPRRVSENTLERIPKDELQKLCARYPVIILGGIGFSGLNPHYNADNINYGSTLTNREQDVELTNRFFNIYKNLNTTLNDLPVIVLTHTPFSDWSSIPYNKNWIYVNGHNHINSMAIDEERTVYSDNQVGYYNENPELKFFTSSLLNDIFHFYDDGIYEISAEDYMDFNRYLGIRMSDFKRKGKIHMVKSSSKYMFFYENTAKNKRVFYILNGGAIKLIYPQNLEYFLDNIPRYSDAIKNVLAPYYKALNKFQTALSNSVVMVIFTAQ